VSEAGETGRQQAVQPPGKNLPVRTADALLREDAGENAGELLKIFSTIIYKRQE
jgi:hypothetical protein